MKRVLLILSLLLPLVGMADDWANAIIRSASYVPALVSDCTTVADSRAITDGANYTAVGSVAGTTYKAGKFTAGSTYSCCKVAIFVAKTGSTGDGLFIELRSDDSDKPGTVLGTSDTVLEASIPAMASSNWVAFSFSSAVNITSNSVYWVTAKRSGSVSGTYYNWWYLNSVIANGIMGSTNGTTWNATTARGAGFKTYK